jgi:hypothetical protein
MKTKMNIQKSTLLRNILNKLFKSYGNVEKVPQGFMGKKADSPGIFFGKISNLVGILLWIIVLLNLIITFLIYKIIF